MTKQFGAASVALLLLCTLPSLAQKKVPPQAIRFQGAPEYTQEELFVAAGLKPGTRLNSAQVKAHARQLNDTGLFKEVKFTSDSKGLLFTLTPASQLFPMHLDNVPLTPGKEMDAKLHERFPLYRSLLPAGGSMVEGMCRTFEEMLAAKGAKVKVQAALTSGIGTQKLTAVNFTVVSPAVRLGRIQLAGISPAMQAKAGLLAGGQTGNSFNTEGTPIDLKHVFEDLYQDQGYAAVQVDVAQVDELIVSDQSVDVPYTITVKEGGVYKLGNIDLPAGALVSRADVQKILSKQPPGSGRPLDLFILAVRDAYSARGYLDCSVVKHPHFDEASHVANYSLEIAPGPQYRLASVKFDGAPVAMGERLKLAWKMAPGDVFDAAYLSSFPAQAQKKDKALAKWMQTVLTTSEFKADPATHEVNCTFHFAKAVQSPG
jgi:outer membrane protein assembly factor BamA